MTTTLIHHHQCALNLLEAIRAFEMRKELVQMHKDGFYSDFPVLIRKAENRIDTIERCIARLQERYGKVMMVTVECMVRN